MFMWLGIDVDDQLQEIKKEASIIENKLYFLHSNLTIPFHISLKMSFNVDEQLFDHIMTDVINIYKRFHSFEIEVKGIENNDTICWIKMKENQTLNEIHDILNDFLLKKYHIPLHEYDLDYQFHTTLFMDEDKDKVSKAYQLIQHAPVPKVLRVNKMIIGRSPNGALGTYHVFKEYLLDDGI